MATANKPYRTYMNNRNAQKYPWDEWMQPGWTFTLKRGIHYHCQTHGMAGQVRNQARKRGMDVSVNIVGETIEFTVSQ